MLETRTASTPVSAPIRLAEGLQSRLTEAVKRMVTAIAAEVPYYARLPPAMLHGEVAEVCRRNLLSYLRCARQGRPPTEAELDDVREPALRRAEEGVPLDAVLLAWEIGNRVTWELMAEGQRPGGEVADLLAATRHSRLFLHAYVRVVSASYVAEREAIEREAGGGLRALAEQLLTGRPASPATSGPAVALAERYVVLVLALSLNPEERGARGDRQAASRRKVRRLQGRLDQMAGEMAGETVLTTLSGSGGTVLFPVGRVPLRAAELRALLVELTELTDGQVLAAAGWPESLRLIPQAVEQAHDLLRLATALSLPPGLYLLDDLLLELPLLRSPEVCARLAALLAPAEAVPELLPTLQAWLQHDRNRRETAEALYVHANTLDRRLERLASLTGLDLGTARGLATVQAALAARALRRAGL